MSIKLPRIKLTRLDSYFLIYFFVSYFVIILIQGPSNDGSLSSELGMYADGFYRSLVGGDEAVWHYNSTMLLNQGLCFDQSYNLALGYYKLCNGHWISSTIHVFGISAIRLFVSFDYLVVLVKSFIVFLAFYSLFRYSRALIRVSPNSYMRCFSSVVFLVLFNPLFLWFSNTLLRDDYILLMASFSLFLFCLKRSFIIGMNKYVFALLVMMLLSVNYRLYLGFLPAILLLCEACYGLLRLKIKAFKLILASSSIAILFYAFSASSYYLNSFVLPFLDIFLSFFKPLPSNVITIAMGEADPIKFVYIFNFFFVIIFFTFLFTCLVRNFNLVFRDWFLPLLPLILFDFVYRFIMVSFHGDINGPRQCFGISSIELFIFAFGLMRFTRLPGWLLSSEFYG